MNYTLIKDDLGYMRCSPLPSQDELDKLYRDEFYTTAKPRYIERMEDDWEWWDETYSDRLGILLEATGIWGRIPTMLDMGCGAGFFLYTAKRNRWKAFGYEPNGVARDYATIRHKAIVYDEVPDGFFDAINLDQCVEHLRNPLQMLQDCADRLLPGGAICVVVPNEKFDSTGNLVYPHVFQPIQHLNYFTFESIENLMNLAGFEIYERSSTFPMEVFLQMGLNYVRNEMMGRLCHQMRKMFDLSMSSAERRKFYREMASAGYGRECVIYGVKREK